MSDQESTDALFGGNGSELLGGDCGGCGTSGAIFGGSFSAMKHLSDGGKVNITAWISLALTVVTLVILIVLLMPWVAPDTWKSLLDAPNVVGDFCRWIVKQDVKVLFGIIGGYFVWHEVVECQ
jgi:hypothetical protein